jgi:transposase-like protein
MTETMISLSTSEDTEIEEENDEQMDITNDISNHDSNVWTKRTKKRKYKSFTIQRKLEAIDWYKSNGENQSKTARHFNTSRQNIDAWLKNEEEYRILSEIRSVSIRTRRTLLKPRVPKYPELEARLLEWFKEKRSGKLAVNYDLLISKAIGIFNEIKTSSEDKFCGSIGWLKGFLQRNRLTSRSVTTVGQKIPVNARN